MRNSMKYALVATVAVASTMVVANYVTHGEVFEAIGDGFRSIKNRVIPTAATAVEVAADAVETTADVVGDAASAVTDAV